MDGVVPNPRLSLVKQGVELCKKEGVDFILAIGGGSAIDSSKAVSYTHLDVYKRQVQGHGRGLYRLVEGVL